MTTQNYLPISIIAVALCGGGQQRLASVSRLTALQKLDEIKKGLSLQT